MIPMANTAEIANFFDFGIWSVHNMGIGNATTIISKIRLTPDTLR